MSADLESRYAAALAKDARRIARRSGGKIGALPHFKPIASVANMPLDNAEMDARVLKRIAAGVPTEAQIRSHITPGQGDVARSLERLLVAGRIAKTGLTRQGTALYRVTE